MKNNISTAMLEEILALDSDERAAILQFCKDSEAMTDEEVASITITKQGPPVLQTLQRKAVRRAKSAIRRRERKVSEVLNEQPARQHAEQPAQQPVRPVGTAPTLFAPGEPVILSSETLQRIEWATETFPREVRLALSQKIDQILYAFRRLPADEILLAQAMVHNAFSDVIGRIMSPLLIDPSPQV